LCEKLTFIGYVCHCLKIWSLDISVKYAQCMKIWMFLKCVQFHEVLCLVSGEVCAFWRSKRGDTPTECTSRILVKGDVPTERASHILLKGDARCGGVSPFLLNMHKKRKPYRLFSTGMLLAPARGMPVGTDTPNVFVPMVTQRPGARSIVWSTSCLKSLNYLD
jgi:hypothetical protein